MMLQQPLPLASTAPSKMKKQEKYTLKRLAVFVLSIFALDILVPVEGRTSYLADRSRVSLLRERVSAIGKEANSAVGRTSSEESVSASSSEDNDVGVQKGDVKMFNRGNSVRSFVQSDKPSSRTSAVENRKLSSSSSPKLKSCCATNKEYTAMDLCEIYGQDCTGTAPQDIFKEMIISDDEKRNCKTKNAIHNKENTLSSSFVGISFSRKTERGMPRSYQLCDQFPMENLIDRDYVYIMSMDENGWLVGGGYGSFDFSGKFAQMDSAHLELLSVGHVGLDSGGISGDDGPRGGAPSLDEVHEAISSVPFPPMSIFPEYIQLIPAAEKNVYDLSLVVSIVETFDDDNSFSAYQQFMENLYNSLESIGASPCMNDGDSDPQIILARGVRFWSSSQAVQYLYKANLEVAVWQSMYPFGTPIGSTQDVAFPPSRKSGNKAAKGSNYSLEKVGYGNIYFFINPTTITKAFRPNRDLTEKEAYSSELFSSSTYEEISRFYSETSSIPFDFVDSIENDYKYDPLEWNATTSSLNDRTKGWQLPPNCLQDGEAFFGIPLSRSSTTMLQSATSFQEQFDFEYLADRNGTYIASFHGASNRGWLFGEPLGVTREVGSVMVGNPDTAHIPLFRLGSLDREMGGLGLSNVIKVARKIDFDQLYIKPAFVFLDPDDGHLKLQFEADPTSSLGWLYDELCRELGIDDIAQSRQSAYNIDGEFTSCAMHYTSDRASFGCGQGNDNQSGKRTGGFCPRATLAYSPKFISQEAIAAYLEMANGYVDYWRQLYPNGVAVGSRKFCPRGGCLALFLNRIDLYEPFPESHHIPIFETRYPTQSPAPTYTGGCDDPRNAQLDRCFRLRYDNANKESHPLILAWWYMLGPFAKFLLCSVLVVSETVAVFFLISRICRRRRQQRRRRRNPYHNVRQYDDDNDYNDDDYSIGSGGSFASEEGYA